MKNWTVLAYLAGDNGRFLSSLEAEGQSDLREMKEAGSSDAVDIVAQFDAMTDHCCRRYYLRRGGSLADDVVQTLGETNSGDAHVLIDFITWGMRNFPAQHYLLVLWNHGSGWKDEDIYAPYRALQRRGGLPATPPQITGRRVSRAVFRHTLEAILEEEANQVLLSRPTAGAARTASTLPAAWLRPTGPAAQPTVTALRSGRPPRPRAICFDDSSKDFLDSLDLTRVLEAATVVAGRPIDVLGMDACLMSMIEVAYQVRNGAAIMVGSEDVEPGSGWPYARILSELVEAPTMAPAQLAKNITAHYVASYDLSLLMSDPITQSALDLASAPAAVAALDELATGLLAAGRQRLLRETVTAARRRAQSFADADYVDLYDFCSLLVGKPGARPVHNACRRLLAAIEPGADGSLVLADDHAGLTERNAHGLSIYFPTRGVSPFYATLDMSRDCAWAHFLDEYLA